MTGVQTCALPIFHFGKASCGVAFLDISTGEFLTAEGPFDYIDKLLNNFAPKEVLFERGKRGMFEGNFGSKFFTFELDDWVFNESSSREKLLKHFETKNLKGFGVDVYKRQPVYYPVFVCTIIFRTMTCSFFVRFLIVYC